MRVCHPGHDPRSIWHGRDDVVCGIKTTLNLDEDPDSRREDRSFSGRYDRGLMSLLLLSPLSPEPGERGSTKLSRIWATSERAMNEQETMIRAAGVLFTRTTSAIDSSCNLDMSSPGGDHRRRRMKRLIGRDRSAT